MQIEFKATKRDLQGTGASRRLRRAGQLPGIIYGANQDATPVTLDHNELYHLMRKEAFHASVLSIDLGERKESVILRDAQWHPFKRLVLHVDFQRVIATEKLHMSVPLHFINEEASPVTKLSDQMISHVITEVEVSCLPKDLPEFIEVDLTGLEPDQSIHLSEIALPAGVEIIQHGDEDPVVVTTLKTGGGTEVASEEGEEGEAE
jgi:large subunit ribosomal protein L25